MSRIFVYTLLAILYATAPFSQSIDVRSGEHEGFSRLVFMYPVGTEWSIAPYAQGIHLTTTGKNFTYNTSRVFELIPKTRVQSLSPALDSNGIFIKTQTKNPPTAFQLENGAVVIDIGNSTSEENQPNTTQSSVTDGYRNDKYSTENYSSLYWKEYFKNSNIGPQPMGQSSANKQKNENFPKTNQSNILSSTYVVESISRAASQGLLDIEKSERYAISNRNDEFTIDNHQNKDTPSHYGHVAKTIIDRDTQTSSAKASLSTEGSFCPSDEDYDIGAWMEGLEPSDLISNARLQLVHEFDRPIQDNVEKLVRRYLALGFGAEAKASYKALLPDDEFPRNFLIISSILDEINIDLRSDEKSFASCGGKSSLWYFLAETDKDMQDANYDAIILSYSALPPKIKSTIGPMLVDKLLLTGAHDAAESIKAILRLSNIDGYEYIESKINAHSGKINNAIKALDDSQNANLATEASKIALEIDRNITEKTPVSIYLIQDATAIAKQMKGTSEELSLMRAIALGFASNGNFEAAFSEIERPPLSKESIFKFNVEDMVYRILLDEESDQKMAISYFKNKKPETIARIDNNTRVRLAARLSKMGFLTEVSNIVPKESKNAGLRSIALANAALATNDNAAALSYITSMRTEDITEEAQLIQSIALTAIDNRNKYLIKGKDLESREYTNDEDPKSAPSNTTTTHQTEVEKDFIWNFLKEDKIYNENINNTDASKSNALKLIYESKSDRDLYEKYTRTLLYP